MDLVIDIEAIFRWTEAAEGGGGVMETRLSRLLMGAIPDIGDVVVLRDGKQVRVISREWRENAQKADVWWRLVIECEAL